jgi:hypothetical protein
MTQFALHISQSSLDFVYNFRGTENNKKDDVILNTTIALSK